MDIATQRKGPGEYLYRRGRYVFEIRKRGAAWQVRDPRFDTAWLASYASLRAAKAAIRQLLGNDTGHSEGTVGC